jgi:hypothetical protein
MFSCVISVCFSMLSEVSESLKQILQDLERSVWSKGSWCHVQSECGSQVLKVYVVQSGRSFGKKNRFERHLKSSLFGNWSFKFFHSMHVVRVRGCALPLCHLPLLALFPCFHSSKSIKFSDFQNRYFAISTSSERISAFFKFGNSTTVHIRKCL